MVHISADYRGLGPMLGVKMSPTFFACFYCKMKGFFIGKGKIVYTALWRWLPLGHRGRNSRAIKVNPPTIISQQGNIQTLRLDTATKYNIIDPPPPPKTIADLRAAPPPDNKRQSVLWILPWGTLVVLL